MGWWEIFEEVAERRFLARCLFLCNQHEISSRSYGGTKALQELFANEKLLWILKDKDRGGAEGETGNEDKNCQTIGHKVPKKCLYFVRIFFTKGVLYIVFGIAKVDF